MLPCNTIDFSLLPTRGPCSRYEIDTPEGKVRGKLEFTIVGEMLRVSLNLHLCLTKLTFLYKTPSGYRCRFGITSF